MKGKGENGYLSHVQTAQNHNSPASRTRAEICSYARKHFRSPLIVEFGTYVDLIACTTPDIIKPAGILRNLSGALEGNNVKMSKTDNFCSYIFHFLNFLLS